MIKCNFKRILFSLLFAINCGLAYSTNCFPGKSIGEARKESFENSDVVFLGVLTHYDENNIATIKVSEVYKGTVDTIAFVEFAIYDEFSSKEGIYHLWLIYGNRNNDNDIIFVKVCSLSRFVGRFSLLPPPPPTRLQKNRNMPLRYRRLQKRSFKEINENIFLYSIIKETHDSNYAHWLFFEEIEVLRLISK
jgi:hypothetical protein